MRESETIMFKEIMVPFDGSEHARRALEVAKGMVLENPEATLYLVSVTASTVAQSVTGTDGGQQIAGVPMFLAEKEEYKHLVDSVLDQQRQALSAQAGDTLANLGDRVVVDVAVAPSAADGIVDYAQKNGCDLIVMGRRGLGALRGMLGSVSYGVLHSADVPVMTVK